MDLKHLEELSKDKDLVYGFIYMCLNWFDVDSYDWDEDNLPKPKYFKDLTEQEKADLIEDAHYFWLKEDSDIGLSKICDVVMSLQVGLLNNEVSKSDFFDALYNTI